MLRNLLIIGCLLSSVTVFAQKQSQTAATTSIDYKAMGAPLPPVRVAVLGTRKEPKDTLDKIITNKDVDNNANLIVMLFNPTCSHCEEQTQLLEKNIALFKKTKLLMIATPAMRPYLPAFLKSYNINQYPSIITGLDSAGTVDKLFLYKMLPQLNIYNHDRKLIKTFNSGTSIDSLKQYIE